MTIGKKLTIAACAMLVMVLCLSFSSLYGTRTLGGALDTAVSSTAAKTDLVGAIRVSFEQMKHEATATQIIYVIQLFYHAASQGSKPEVDGVQCTMCHQSDTLAGHKQKFEETASRLQQELKQLRPLATSAAAIRAVQTFETGVTQWSSLYQQYLQHANRGDFSGAHLILTQQMFPMIEEIEKSAAALSDENRAELARSGRDAQRAKVNSLWAALGFSALGILVALAVVMLVNKVSRLLRQIATQLGSEAEQVASSAAQMSSSSQVLAEGASEQAAALEQTSASMEQMSSVTHKNADNTRSAAGLMTSSDQVVQIAEHTIQEMTTSMHEISVSGEKITEVVKLIDDIAFQTKILSLNAAVEAARAGDAGAGFAVVADQVGHLAQECAQAARNTAEMIEGTVTRVREGATKLQRVTAAINDVVKHSSQVKVLVDEVHVGSEEQALGIDQVGRAVAQMQEVTQRTAANAEEAASAGQVLDSRADKLKRIVSDLETLVGCEEAGAEVDAVLVHETA